MENKNILITGISTGIGKDAALFLAAKGFTIYGTVRKESDASFIKQNDLTSIKSIILDVTDKNGILSLADKMKDIPLVGLINNAGIAVSGPLKYIDLEEVKKGFEVNVFGLLAMTQAFLPNLELNKQFRGEGGRIINISSISGRMVTPFTVPYSSTKYAVESISDGLRRELFHLGIKVSIIEPGPIKTPIWDKAKAADTKAFIKEYSNVLEFRNDFIQQTIDGALEVKEVSKAIYHALVSTKPKTRYLVVKRPWLSKLIFNLPSSFVDYIAMKKVKLK